MDKAMLSETFFDAGAQRSESPDQKDARVLDICQKVHPDRLAKGDTEDP